VECLGNAQYVFFRRATDAASVSRNYGNREPRWNGLDSMSDSAKICVISACRKPASRVFEKSGADIFVCSACGCIMASVEYDADQYESDDYYTMASDDVRDLETRWGFRSRYILAKVLEHSGAEPTLLDVGAGNGYFVHVAQRDLGLAATGIEISATAVKFSEDVLGVKLICGDAADHTGQYDIVTSFNVIEHVQKPEDHLADLLRLTKTGGYVVITTPNPSCIQRRVVGLKNWKMICPPHHINLFTMKALTAMTKSADLEIVAHETLSTYVKVVKDIDTDGLLLRRLFFNTFRLLGLGADHLVVAKKA